MLPGPGADRRPSSVTAGGAAGPMPEPGGSRPRACRRAGDLALSGDAAGSPGLRLGRSLARPRGGPEAGCPRRPRFDSGPMRTDASHDGGASLRLLQFE